MGQVMQWMPPFSFFISSPGIWTTSMPRSFTSFMTRGLPV